MIYNSIKNYAIIVLGLILLSCNNQNSKYENDTKPVSVLKDTVITTLGDSSFLADVRSMHHDKNFLYLTDYKRNQIIILDQMGKLIKTLGQTGNGPGEFQGAYHIYVQNDTIHVYNDFKKRIELFTHGGFIKSVNFDHGVSPLGRHRFAYNQGRYYLSSLKDEYTNVCFSQQKVNFYFSKIKAFETDIQTKIRNRKHVLPHNKTLISVSDNLPVIERYCMDGKIIDQLDFSNVYLVEDYLSYRSQNPAKADNSYSNLLNDIYIANDNLYLLMYSYKAGKVMLNNVLEIALAKDKMSVKKLYDLGEGWFDSICIIDNYIWTF